MSPHRPGRSARAGTLAVALLSTLCHLSCGGRPVKFLGEPLPADCREQADLSESRRCLGWILDRAFIARTHRYEHESLERYVDGVGQRLAAATERPDIAWTFRILDDPDIQAYALVGGYVYTSRGALAVLGSEAELAALLAHEMAHVAAGHSEDTILAMADATTEYDQLFARYFERERDEERQADELAAGYLRRAGYEPRAMLSMLERIHRDWRVFIQPAGSDDDGDDDEATEDASSWLRTHPPGPVRRARVARVIAGWERAELSRARYDQAIQGLVVGRDPRSGYLEGQTYIHVKAGISWQLSDTWELSLGEQYVRALTERDSQTSFATLMPIGVGHYQFFRDGLDARRSVTVRGMRMTVGWLTPDATKALSMDSQVDEIRHLRAGLVALAASHILILVAGAERARVAAHFTEVVRGFRSIAANEIRATWPRRIVSAAVTRTGTVRELAGALCPESVALTIELAGGDSRAQRVPGDQLRCVRRAPGP